MVAIEKDKSLKTYTAPILIFGALVCVVVGFYIVKHVKKA